MTEDIKHLLTTLRATLDALETSIKPERAVIYPANLMQGYYLAYVGLASSIAVRGVNRSGAERLFRIGNWFATKAEAEQEVKRSIVIQKMWGYGGTKEDSYTISYIVAHEEFSVELKPNRLGDGIFMVRFEEEADAQLCIHALGSEILEVL